ncbi:MAG: hypothetical protein M3Z97_02715 [Candidatus Dormibacteraeota bacterium]|nr:hypothetical protein [Candidatus Dormibacteraeota bacterium]
METSEAPQQRANERLTLAIEGAPDSDAEELARLTGQLRSQLLELDVDRVDLVRGGQAPPGSKVADPITIGAIIITLAPTLIQAVIGLVQNWHKDHPVSSVKVTLGDDSLELSNASPEQVEQLAQAFIARHSTS